VHEEGDRVRLSVRDSGVGVESQVLARLFEPFYTTKSDGMGIGLFVSRSIIESHRGSLRVTANEGPGVTFSFSVPRARWSVLAGIRVAPSPKVMQWRARADSGRVIGAPR
jgi:signal transduction histidine kinase